MLYEDSKIEEIQVEFNHEIQSEDDTLFGWSHVQGQGHLQGQWEASVASICADIASFDPRLYGKNNREKKKFFDSKSNSWKSVDLPFDDSEVAMSDLPPDELPGRATRADPAQVYPLGRVCPR